MSLRFSSRLRRGAAAFTLIELLVVISIIAILASLAFPAVNGAIDTAKRAKAKNDVVQIVTAIKAYQTEYGKLPIYNSQSVYEGNNDQLFNILRSLKELNGEQLDMNPRRIAFVEVRPGKGKKDGIGDDGVFYDPWGKPYKIILDGDYDNTIPNPYGGGAGFKDLLTAAIVVSSGKDGQGLSGDKNSGVAKDDIISWQ